MLGRRNKHHTKDQSNPLKEENPLKSAARLSNSLLYSQLQKDSWTCCQRKQLRDSPFPSVHPAHLRWAWQWCRWWGATPAAASRAWPPWAVDHHHTLSLLPHPWACWCAQPQPKPALPWFPLQLFWFKVLSQGTRPAGGWTPPLFQALLSPIGRQLFKDLPHWHKLSSPLTLPPASPPQGRSPGIKSTQMEN